MFIWNIPDRSLVLTTLGLMTKDMLSAHPWSSTKVKDKRLFSNKYREKFCLKTIDYQTNISKSFQNLRTQDEFCDVTLVGEDFTQVEAHKVVLPLCSEYFKRILLNNKNIDTVLVFTEPQQREIKQIYSFVIFVFLLRVQWCVISSNYSILY